MKKRDNSRIKYSKTGRYGYIFTAPYLILYLIFGLFPILFTLGISFTDWTGIGEFQFVGLKNYRKLFTNDPLFLKSIGNTVILMIGYIPVLLVGGLLLATTIFDKALRGKRFFQLSNFLPYITTPVAIGLVFSLLFDWSTGIINRLLMQAGLLSEELNWLGDASLARIVVIIMVIWKLLGYHMIIFLAGLTNISADIYEAAKVDGAGKMQEFIYITIPMMKNILAFLLITDIINGFQLVEEPMLLFTGWMGTGGLVGGPDKSCYTAIWNMYNTAFVTKMNLSQGSAIAYGVFLFIIGFSAISIKIQKGRTEK